MKPTQIQSISDRISFANIGDYVGAVDGCGKSPLDSVWIVTEKQSGRFGSCLVVKNCEGAKETVHSFTKVGIGWYYLGETIK